jgi:hypothetical protein
MDYKNILTEMLGEFRAEIDGYRSGEKDRYFYKCKHTEEYADIDENYGARGRLLYGLRFGAAEVGEPEREQMVRELFEQEIIAREKSSFQGIGANLELLSVLMEQYRKPEDKPMYERAKNANFDCYCGFGIDESYAAQYPADIYEYSLVDSIYLASELGMKEKLLRLVDIYKAEGLEGDRILMFKGFARMTGRDDDREIAVKGCYERAFSGESADMNGQMDQLSAAEAMIEWLCDKGEISDAFALFKKHTDVLRSANGRAFFEMAHLIMEADNALIRDVWEHLSTYLARDITDGKLYPICLQDAKKCAELAGAKLTVRQLEKMQKTNR